MGIVRFALKYPHTFYVVAALILFLGVTAAVEMPTDIFPEINIPVVSVIWQYTGLNTTEMEQRFTTYSQYAISSNVNGIKDIEAETVNGISVQKIYFQPDVNLDLAISQIVAATNAIRALLPTGTQPPIVVQYSASAVPVLQISLSSDRLSESQLYDYGIYRLRQMIAPIHGVTLPTPAGGKYRQIMVDIDQTKLLSKGPDAAAGRECGQRAEPDPARRRCEDRQDRLHRPHQFDAADDRGAQRHPGQLLERRHRLPQGHRSCARRQSGAAEHRPGGRQTLGPAQHHQERQCLDIDGRQCGQAHAGRSRGPRRPPAWSSNRCSISRCSSPRR